jgi:proteasome beta subunit
LAHDEAMRVAVEALIDAAEDDVATGGPDLARGIFPVIVTVTAEGATESTDDDVSASVRAVLETRS